MNTELYMEGYRLDLSAEISALLNFSIDDVKDFSARSTTWSKTIVLPGTANNNRLFGHIFQVGQSNNYDGTKANVGFNFNAAKSASCVLFQDQIQTFKGVLRLLQVNISDGFQGRTEYEVSVFGTLVGLNSSLSGKLLEDLDFSAYDHVYNDTNIVNSWDNPGGSGVYYPLIDYGTYSTNKHDWDLNTFRPALYVKEYVDKIFASASKRYVAPLFGTPRFKSLVIPHSKKIMTVGLTDLYAADAVSTAYGTPPVNVQNFGTELHTVPIKFSTSTGTGFTANAGTDKITFTFNGLVTTNIELRVLFQISSFLNPGNTGPGVGYIDIWKNAQFDVNGGPTSGTFIKRLTFPGSQTVTVGTGVVINISVAPGDKLDFRLSQEGFYAGQIDNVTFNISHFDVKAAGGATVAVPIIIGDTVKLNDNIPRNIRQIDFLVGLVKMFNLYITEDKDDSNLFYITPYIDFYSKNFSNAVDWSDKLNRNKVTKVKPMSELNAKIYKFKFKQDSDYYNDLYRKRYNEGYGDRIYDSEFEFTQQTSELEICFSGTPLVGYNGVDKVYSTIFKRTGSDSAPVEENVDSNIRILQTKKVTGVVMWGITTNNAGTVLNYLTRYGYAGHLDSPDIPTNDLNFGAPKELFFILSAGNMSDNQFNVYWSGYMREITDKDSKLVTANFYLNARDILNLDFSKYVYVDGIAFRLNAIKDYDASKPNDCVVELLKVNSASYSESSSNSGPPAGCYLLWRDENTLDWDTTDELLYGDCNTNPGDGGSTPPPPPDTNTIEWTFTTNNIISFGKLNIYVNGVLTITQTTSSPSKIGSFQTNAGDAIKVDVIASFNNRKRSMVVSNDVDGLMHSDAQQANLTYTFNTSGSKNYNITSSVNI